MKNALTIDVEDYFQVTAFDGVVKRQDWKFYPSRVENNTRRVLDLLDEYSLSGTFFVLGWVAEHYPGVVQAIANGGHEVACHGYGHDLVYNMQPSAFRADVRRSKALLEDLIGVPVVGYRAPSYSITSHSMWALDILIEEGFTYDSSIFPIVHDNYGIPGSERFPYDIVRNGGSIREFPLTTLALNFVGRKVVLPIAGGGYLRLLPAELVLWGMRSVNTTEKQPVVLYFHPWEMDPDQPRIKARLKSRFRHYLNLDTTEDKVRCIVSGLRFDTMARVLGLDGNNGDERGRETATDVAQV